ncbi:CTP synthase [Agrocybe pediades]|nr:CTP synthase [Agrocybe pediades]
MTKYILVSGGVVSGIGKGVIASSTGLLLKTTGLKVTAIKIDPYMNIDAGTMRPTEHGEVYVLNDGGEVDLDLGNYERYLNVTLSRDNNITTGKIYREVIEKERKGEYLGKTVQIVPHLTNAIQDWIERVAAIPVDESNEQPDVCIVELGGTVGDIESAPFVEAMRQFQFRVGHDNFALVHVSLVPVMGGEQKTKPTQTTVHCLRGLGLMPDVIACRLLGPQALAPSTKDKISMFCHVSSEQVLGVHDVSSVYHVPLLLQAQGIVEYLTRRLKLDELAKLPTPAMALTKRIGKPGAATPPPTTPTHTPKSRAVKPLPAGKGAHKANGASMSISRSTSAAPSEPVSDVEEVLDESTSSNASSKKQRREDGEEVDLVAVRRVWEERRAKGKELSKRWRELTAGQERLFDTVSIALVGKYTDLKDSYMSVTKALEHSAFRVHRKLTIQWVESSDLEPETQESNPAKYHDAWRAVVGSGGILVPGGFGNRGTEGMMLAIKYAREQKVPFLGICLGFQLAVVEWARNVLDIQDATSAEFYPDAKNPLIIFMPEISKTHMGGTMRLGLRPTVFGDEPAPAPSTSASSPAPAASTSTSSPASTPAIATSPPPSKPTFTFTFSPKSWLSSNVTTKSTTTKSKVRKLYGGAAKIWERHRHRYEVNPAYVERLVKSGMNFIGKDEKGERMQVCELDDHPYFVGLQAHPEFCTRPLNPSPPFLGFVAASCSPAVLEEQMRYQMETYVPPHPESAMVSERELKSAEERREKEEQEKRGGGAATTTKEEKADPLSAHMKVVQAVNEDH